MDFALIAIPALTVFLAPSVGWFLVLHRGAPRADSLFAQAKRAALLRLVVVGLVTVLHAALLVELVTEPAFDPPLAGHQFGPKMEAWQSTMAMSSIITLLVSLLGLLVLAGGFLWEISIAWKATATARWAKDAVPCPPPADARAADVDFGIGDAWLAHRAEVPGSIYRGDAPAIRFVRGAPRSARFWVGPVVSVLAFVTAFLFLGTTLLLSLGD